MTEETPLGRFSTFKTSDEKEPQKNKLPLDLEEHYG